MIYWLARMSGFWDAAEIGPGRSRIENDATTRLGHQPARNPAVRGSPRARCRQISPGPST